MDSLLVPDTIRLICTLLKFQDIVMMSRTCHVLSDIIKNNQTGSLFYKTTNRDINIFGSYYDFFDDIIKFVPGKNWISKINSIYHRRLSTYVSLSHPKLSL